jgi:hypothetical protein
VAFDRKQQDLNGKPGTSPLSATQCFKPLHPLHGGSHLQELRLLSSWGQFWGAWLEKSGVCSPAWCVWCVCVCGVCVCGGGVCVCTNGGGGGGVYVWVWMVVCVWSVRCVYVCGWWWCGVCVSGLGWC